MEIEKKLYGGIDLLRLPCAMLIIFTHTYSFDWGMIGSGIRYILSSIGVPFFFIVSGFFFTKGLIKNRETPEKYLKSYLIRMVIMYCIWTVLTLPVAIYNIRLSKPEYGVLMIIIRLIRSFFLSGSMGIYWYLLALIYGSFFLYLMYRKPKLEIPIYVFAVLFFTFGVLYASGIASEIPVLSTFANILHILFGSERNIFTVGLFYLSIGFFFAKHSCRLPSMGILILGFALSVGLKTAEFLLRTSLHAISVFHLFAAFFLFLIGLKWNCPIRKETALFLRKYSTGLYLIHFPFILLFDFSLNKHGTIVNFGVTFLFATAVYMFCHFVLPKRINGFLYG